MNGVSSQNSGGLGDSGFFTESLYYLSRRYIQLSTSECRNPFAKAVTAPQIWLCRSGKGVLSSKYKIFTARAYSQKFNAFLFVTGENYAFVSTFLRCSSIYLPLLVPAAPLPSCGYRLCLYCVIEIPRAIFRNNARVRVRCIGV